MILTKTRDVEIWSCGGGTQSGAIAALIGEGRLPKPDLSIMVDVGRERSATWPFVDGFIRPQLAKVGATLHVIPKDEFATVDLLGTNGDILIPGYTDQNGSVGKLPAYCSNEWKQRVTQRYLRSIGVETARLWFGISRDEMKRVRTPTLLWLRYWYPLIFELAFDRLRCVQLIRAMGWEGPIPHSACWMCPNANNDEWLDMKLYHAADFEQACELEVELQKVDPHFWFHETCTPLSTVDFTAQGTFFADRGCTGGCFT